MKWEEAKAILLALADHEVRFVLIGSMAMAAHGLVRATRDIDIFVDPASENVARLRSALRTVFDDPHIDEISAEDLGGEYPAVQYVPPAGDYWLDIMARLGDAFRFDDLETDRVLLDGRAIPVASPRMLYRMKKDTVRPQDHVDAERLRQEFGLDEA